MRKVSFGNSFDYAKSNFALFRLLQHDSRLHTLAAAAPEQSVLDFWTSNTPTTIFVFYRH